MSPSASSPGLADPTLLDPFTRKPESSSSGTAHPGQELLQVVIETPRGSRNKYSFDPDERVFRLKAALPAGMVFPYDFGFIPRSIGGDGDPLDILVLMEEPAFPGCVLLVRLLGVMEAEQVEHADTDHPETQRNDRLIGVAETAQIYANFDQIDAIPVQMRTEIEQFFSNYHQLQGKRSRTLAWSDTPAARDLISEALLRYKNKP
ncbi:MAG TPA: inorganic diphosphatase [Acidobacteriaceae bacterium]|jgi:inorganic pyrophosphatase|nr:inorganic diphosphatase [Acidobacteriaceae bacterium]